MKYFSTITQISVGMQNDNPIFGDCVRIKLEDEGGGMFILFEQEDYKDDTQQVRIGLDEWQSICQAVAMLTKQPLVK